MRHHSHDGVPLLAVANSITPVITARRSHLTAQARTSSASSRR